jgi:hypothetical protein
MRQKQFSRNDKPPMRPRRLILIFGSVEGLYALQPMQQVTAFSRSQIVPDVAATVIDNEG